MPSVHSREPGRVALLAALDLGRGPSRVLLCGWRARRHHQATGMGPMQGLLAATPLCWSRGRLILARPVRFYKAYTIGVTRINQKPYKPNRRVQIPYYSGESDTPIPGTAPTCSGGLTPLRRVTRGTVGDLGGNLMDSRRYFMQDLSQCQGMVK